MLFNSTGSREDKNGALDTMIRKPLIFREFFYYDGGKRNQGARHKYWEGGVKVEGENILGYSLKTFGRILTVLLTAEFPERYLVYAKSQYVFGKWMDNKEQKQKINLS